MKQEVVKEQGKVQYRLLLPSDYENLRQLMYDFKDPHLTEELKQLSQQEVPLRHQKLQDLWNWTAEEAVKRSVSFGAFAGGKMVAFSAVMDLKHGGAKSGQFEKICWPHVYQLYSILQKKLSPEHKQFLDSAEVALVHSIHTSQSHRGRGIQKKLAYLTEQAVKKHGFQGMFLFSNNGVTDHIFVDGLGCKQISVYDTHDYHDKEGKKIFELTSEFNRYARLLLKKFQ